jgi:hypothetical protein
MNLQKMTDEELRELVRACARELAWHKEQERRRKAKEAKLPELKNDILALARRAGLSDDEIEVLSGQHP